MNSANSEPESPDLSALWSDLQDLEDGSIAPARRDALMELLQHSSEARREYFEYFHQAAVLRMEADKVQESEQLAKVLPLRKRAWWSRPWVAAAAVFMIAAFIAALVYKPFAKTTDSVPGENLSAVPVDVIPTLDEILNATPLEGTLWELNAEHKDTSVRGLEVKKGDTIRVLSGMLKLELESGAAMVMQGASQASFPSLRKPILQRGWLWIDASSSEEAFEVSTPDLIVRDIGTRFGVRVGSNGQSEIHLIEGGVDVLSQESGIKLTTLAPDGKGHAITEDGKQTELPIADDPFPMLQNLMSVGSMYKKTILVQNPSGYWKFDEAVDAWYDNQVRGRGRAKSGPAVSMHTNGVNEEIRFGGFHPENKSLYFPVGDNKVLSRSVLAFLDAGEGVKRRQGSVTFWIKQKAEATGEQVLWVPGKVHPRYGFPAESHAHSSITASGQVTFVLKSGAQEIRLVSEQKVHDGQWHHVGLSWGMTAAELYLDGKRVAYQNNKAPQEKWISHGNYVRFGKPTDQMYREGFRNFHGWLDEFAVWDRPLNAEEVAQQFQAALGSDQE